MLQLCVFVCCLQWVRDGETTIKIKLCAVEGGGTGGQKENHPRPLFFVGNATTIKFGKCKFYCQEMFLSLRGLLLKRTLSCPSLLDWSLSCQAHWPSARNWRTLWAPHFCFCFPLSSFCVLSSSSSLVSFLFSVSPPLHCSWSLKWLFLSYLVLFKAQLGEPCLGVLFFSCILNFSFYCFCYSFMFLVFSFSPKTRHLGEQNRHLSSQTGTSKEDKHKTNQSRHLRAQTGT